MSKNLLHFYAVFVFGAAYGHQWSFYGHIFGRDDQPKT